MYAVYFDWKEGQRPLWHPLNLPAMDKKTAALVAQGLAAALPNKHWGYGPIDRDGVTEVT